MRYELISVEECESLSPKQVRKLYKDYVNPGLENIFYSFAAGEELVERAEGVWIYFKNGRKILDASGGIGVLNHGHNHPRILAARKKFQEQQRMEVHKTIFSPYMAALSHNLAAILPGDLDYPYFCNSGAEAVEGAMKMAYKYHEGKRKYILHAGISFHGKLLGSGGMTEVNEKVFKFPTIPNIESYEYGNIDSLRSKVDQFRQADGTSDVYAIIIEPFNAIALHEASKEFLQQARRLCDEKGIILIFDEVFCGWCKTGGLFKFIDSDVVPDLLTTSKSLGGGKASISAYIARKPILVKAYGDVATATLHSTTYNGFGEECVTAMEAIRIMVEEDYPSKTREIERIARERGRALKEKFPDVVGDVRGAGALHGVFPVRREGGLQGLLEKLPVQMLKEGNFVNKVVVASIVDWLFKKHDIFTFFNNNQDVGVLFSPPVIIEKKEIDYFYDSMEATFEYGIWKIAAEFIKSKVLKSF